jgi:hypothetical protein
MVRGEPPTVGPQQAITPSGRLLRQYLYDVVLGKRELCGVQSLVVVQCTTEQGFALFILSPTHLNIAVGQHSSTFDCGSCFMGSHTTGNLFAQILKPNPIFKAEIQL